MRLVVILCCALFTTSNFAQNFNPKIAPFKGKVFLIPDEKKTIGFGSYLDSLTPVQEISYKKINIPDRLVEEDFPGVDYRYGFGMILKSTMKIDTPGYYYFNLISDDGSRLWINGRSIVNNDGDHKMMMKSDTVILDKGIHDIKLWYYQAFALRYGFVFESGFHDFYTGTIVPNKDTLVLSGLLFEHDSYRLKSLYKSKIDSLFANINCQNVDKIDIIGHTDLSGSSEYNMNLSIRRAQSVKAYVENLCPLTQIEALGKGETDPIYLGLDQRYLSQNRRVEIILHFAQ